MKTNVNIPPVIPTMIGIVDPSLELSLLEESVGISMLPTM